MATGLYGVHEVFTSAVDEVFAALGPDGGPLRADWLAEAPGVPLDHVTRSQPLLFALDYAYGRVLLDWGVRPAGLLGHSIGEMAAAVLAGVFSLGSAASLVRDRIGRLAAAPLGGMLAVAASTDELAPYLTADVVVGAVNAPRQTVLAGPDEPLRAVAAALRGAGLTCQRVPSLTAFHSPSLAGTVPGARAAFAAQPAAGPSIPIVSGYTAAPLRAEEATDPDYWSSHPVAPVLFWPALERLLETGDLLLVEAGPGQGLTTLARRHPAVRSGRSAVVAMCPARAGGATADLDALNTAAERVAAAIPAHT